MADGDVRVLVFGGIILAYTVFRTLRPIRYEDGPGTVWGVLAEVALCVVVVCTTGYWESPFIFSLMTAVIVAGFARGFGFAIASASGAAAVSIPYLFGATENDHAHPQFSAEWASSCCSWPLVAGYARRISGEAERQHSLALDRLGRLADANALLFSLHRVTQTLPASLDLDEVLDTTISRLRDLFDFDSVGAPGPRRHRRDLGGAPPRGQPAPSPRLTHRAPAARCGGP